MPIRSITRAEFDAFDPYRAPEAELILDELEWFADDAGIVIGLIAIDKADHDHFVGVLGRDQRGTFRAIDVDSCIAEISVARTELMRRMEQALSTGETMFPQRD